MFWIEHIIKQMSNNLKDIEKDNTLIADKMDSLLNAFYHSTKYLYFNNRKLAK